MDDRCPDSHMFEIDAETGFSSSELNIPQGAMFDGALDPEIIIGDLKRSLDRNLDRQTPPFPENGFTLNVAVRYDNLFDSQLSGNSVTRYLCDNCIKIVSFLKQDSIIMINYID